MTAPADEYIHPAPTPRHEGLSTDARLRHESFRACRDREGAGPGSGMGMSGLDGPVARGFG